MLHWESQLQDVTSIFHTKISWTNIFLHLMSPNISHKLQVRKKKKKKNNSHLITSTVTKQHSLLGEHFPVFSFTKNKRIVHWVVPIPGWLHSLHLWSLWPNPPHLCFLYSTFQKTTPCHSDINDAIIDTRSFRGCWLVIPLCDKTINLTFNFVQVVSLFFFSNSFVSHRGEVTKVKGTVSKFHNTNEDTEMYK